MDEAQRFVKWNAVTPNGERSGTLEAGRRVKQQSGFGSSSRRSRARRKIPTPT